jgi:hypothetical protein
VKAHPLVLPAVGHRLDTNVAEARAEPLSPGLVGERDQLGRVGSVDLGEPVRKQLEHRGRRLLDELAGNDDRSAEQAQRKALFSFSKKPSSGRYVSSLAICSNSPSSLR